MSPSTLRLSKSMSVECSPIGNTMWLFVIAEDGRFARVLPTASMGMLERVQSALEDALGTPDVATARTSRR